MNKSSSAGFPFIIMIMAILLVASAATQKKPPKKHHYASVPVSIQESRARPDEYTAATPKKTLTLARVPAIDTPGLRFIEAFEGFESCPFRDSVGTGTPFTRGFGETEGITSRSGCISRSTGERNLKFRLERFYGWAIVRLHASFNQNQIDAIYSFLWNLGAGIAPPGSSLAAALQRHNPFPMLAYDHAQGVVLAGLSRRRHAEVALFLKAAPKPLSLSQAYSRRRALRRALLIHGCDRRRDHRQRLGPKCKRWFAEGQHINAAIRSKGGH